MSRKKPMTYLIRTTSFTGETIEIFPVRQRIGNPTNNACFRRLQMPFVRNVRFDTTETTKASYTGPGNNGGINEPPRFSAKSIFIMRPRIVYNILNILEKKQNRFLTKKIR